MLDGQNLFDDATAYSGTEWQVDETMEALALEGIEAIVVGIPAAPGDERGHEYSGPKVEQHLSFVADTVRPLVERPSTSTRAASGPASRAPHSAASRACTPSTRGRRRSASPASSAPVLVDEDERWFELVERTARPEARIYIDVGDGEMPEDETTRRRYVEGFERMTALLRSRGFDDRSLRAVLEPGGAHFESDWARRLPDALRFLLVG